jgi:hypothetical protein
VTEDQFALITTDPAITHGQPTIAGTRVLVSVVLDCLAAAITTEEILAEYQSPKKGSGLRPPKEPPSPEMSWFPSHFGVRVARLDLADLAGTIAIVEPVRLRIRRPPSEPGL